MGYIVYIILGLYWDNGEENGNYYMLGVAVKELRLTCCNMGMS